MAKLHDARYEACYTLERYGVPCVLWFEDALKYYGVPTILFDLYLVVPNINVAGDLLEQHAWVSVPTEEGKTGIFKLDLTRHPQRRLRQRVRSVLQPESESRSHPGEKMPKIIPNLSLQIVLLSASDWTVDLETTLASKGSFAPALSTLVDSLIENLLNSEDDTPFQDHMHLMLAYLYDYVPELQNTEFASGLRYVHRQYHFDMCSGIISGTRQFTAYEREVREGLRQNTHQLREHARSSENEHLFSDPVQARLLAAMLAPETATKSNNAISSD